MVNTIYKSTKKMIEKLQSLKGERKLKLYKNIGNFFEELNTRIFQFEQDLFSKNAQDISKTYLEILLLMKFSRTKPQVKNMSIKYHDL